MANRQELRSKDYRQKAKTARIFVASLFCLIRFTLAATAQESPYSADSLMATFERGSKVSVKGTEITFHDVVVENKNSKVIFKSTLSGKVICELAASTGNQHNQPSIGSGLTVIGRVRGRGVLGNVTLDNCSVPPINDSTVSQIAAPQEVASAPPEIVSEKAVSPASVPERPEQPANDLATNRSVRPARPVARTVQQQPVLSTGLEHQDETSKRNTDVQRGCPYAFYALLVLSGAVVSPILTKLLAQAVRAVRFSTPLPCENAPEIRQAALQALLQKTSKNNSREVS